MHSAPISRLAVGIFSLAHTSAPVMFVPLQTPYHSMCIYSLMPCASISSSNSLSVIILSNVSRSASFHVGYICCSFFRLLFGTRFIGFSHGWNCCCSAPHMAVRIHNNFLCLPSVKQCLFTHSLTIST